MTHYDLQKHINACQKKNMCGLVHFPMGVTMTEVCKFLKTTLYAEVFRISAC